MSRQTWAEVLSVAETAGAAVANTTTPTSLLPTGAVFTLPANFFDIGKQIEVEAYGKISTTGTPTITFSVYLAGATFCATQAITTGSGITNLTWKMRMLITCRAIGSGTSANAMFTGEVLGVGSATSLVMVPASSPAVSSGFSSTVSNAVDLYATWSAASASNTITLENYTLRALN